MDKTDKVIRAVEKFVSGLEDLGNVGLGKKDLMELLVTVVPKHPLSIRLAMALEKLPDPRDVDNFINKGAELPRAPHLPANKEQDKNAQALQSFLGT